MIDGAKKTTAAMPGCLEQRWYLDCQWCSDNHWVEAESEKEAIAAMVKDGVRRVHHDDTSYIMCPSCTERARTGQLES